MRTGYMRARDVRLTCLACRDTIRMPGPWHGAHIASWSAAHLRPMVAGWTVEVDTKVLSTVDCAVPPAVTRR
jgi:hypothetical protein